jgi:hypothetical protein
LPLGGRSGLETGSAALEQDAPLAVNRGRIAAVLLVQLRDVTRVHAVKRTLDGGRL